MNKLTKLLVLFLAILTLTACGKKKAPPETPEKPVKVLTLKPLDFMGYRTVAGNTYAQKDATISSEVSGKIESIIPKIGQFVKEGQVIIKIDKQMTKAQLQSAKANLNLAQINYNSQKKLYRKKLISEQQFESVSTQLKVAQASYKLAEIQHQNTNIKAPIPGFIAEKYVEQGEFIMPGKPVIRIVRLNKIKVKINVPGKDLRYLNNKDTVRIYIPSYSYKSFQGSVSSIGVIADNKSKTFPVEILLDNPQSKIKAGMLCEVTFKNFDLSNAIVVPRDAILEGKPRTVFVVKEGIAKQKDISIIATEKNEAAITGINPNVQLIYIGHKNIVDGEKVKIIN